MMQAIHIIIPSLDFWYVHMKKAQRIGVLD